MKESEPTIDVMIFSHNMRGQPKLYYADIFPQTRMELITRPPGFSVNVPGRIHGLAPEEQVPLDDIAEHLTPHHWDMFRNMN